MLEAQLKNDEGKRCTQLEHYKFEWTVSPSDSAIVEVPGRSWMAEWTPKRTLTYTIELHVKHDDPKAETLSEIYQPVTKEVFVQARPFSTNEPVTDRLESAVSARTNDDVLFQSMRESSAS